MIEEIHIETKGTHLREARAKALTRGNEAYAKGPVPWTVTMWINPRTLKGKGVNHALMQKRNLSRKLIR